jgi:hypothetical protein
MIAILAAAVAAVGNIVVTSHLSVANALTAELIEAVQQVFPGCCMWFPSAS